MLYFTQRLGRFVTSIIIMLLLVAGVSAQDNNLGHFELPESGIYPEGIAYHPNDNTFYVGSAVDGTIFRGLIGTGEVEIFVPSGRDGNTSVTGMKVDTVGRLWVAGAETGKIFVYDTQSGELIQSYQVPPAPESTVGFFTKGEEVPANLVNDVTIAGNGDAYLTDSYSDIIYRISAIDNTFGDLEVWMTELGGGFINGIAISPDDKYLLVALAEAGGLRHVTIATQEIMEVELDGGMLIPDGILFDYKNENILYATNFGANGSSSIAQVTFTSDDYTSGTVEANFIIDETFAVSTTLAQVEDRLLVVNSQMFTYFDPNSDPTTPWIISNVEIPQR